MRGWPAVLLALALVGRVEAHSGQSVLSVVEIDATSGEVTVSHQMAAHDVEPALVDIAPGAQPSLDDPAALDALKAYASRSFVIRDDEGRRVTLTPSAAALSGDDVELRFTARLPLPAKRLTIDSGLLEESYESAETQVNVRRAGVTRTVVFRGGDAPQAVTFD